MLPDHLAHGLDVIFCGTAAGHRSAQVGHYYARPGNRFWRTLHEVGLTPRRLLPTEDATVFDFGMGLTDLAKNVSGVDRDIPKAAYEPERLDEIVRTWKPKRLAFTSIAAGRHGLGIRGRVAAGIQIVPAMPEVEVWVLPSTSGNNGHWQIAPWRALAESVIRKRA